MSAGAARLTLSSSTRLKALTRPDDRERKKRSLSDYAQALYAYDEIDSDIRPPFSRWMAMKAPVGKQELVGIRKAKALFAKLDEVKERRAEMKAVGEADNTDAVEKLVHSASLGEPMHILGGEHADDRRSSRSRASIPSTSVPWSGLFVSGRCQQRHRSWKMLNAPNN